MGNSALLTIVELQGYKSHQSKEEQNPENNGLHFLTYRVVAICNDVFTSGTVGDFDLNQELIDPMEQR